MIKIKEITPKEYAQWYGCTPQHIHRLLKAGEWKELPQILKIKRYGRFYVLEVPFKFGKNAFKESIRKSK